MNNLEQAAELIENGWCTGQLKNGDGKYCSVGAVLAVNGISEEELFHAALNVRYNDVESPDPYVLADSLPEIQALAAEIRESGKASPASLLDADTVYFWNDTQDDVNEVLEMFKRAAKRL